MRKQAVDFGKKLASSWSDQRAPSMGAALAYYAMFSIAPLLFIAIDRHRPRNPYPRLARSSQVPWPER